MALRQLTLERELVETRNALLALEIKAEKMHMQMGTDANMMGTTQENQKQAAEQAAKEEKEEKTRLELLELEKFREERRKNEEAAVAEMEMKRGIKREADRQAREDQEKVRDAELRELAEYRREKALAERVKAEAERVKAEAERVEAEAERVEAEAAAQAERLGEIRQRDEEKREAEDLRRKMIELARRLEEAEKNKPNARKKASSQVQPPGEDKVAILKAKAEKELSVKQTALFSLLNPTEKNPTSAALDKARLAYCEANVKTVDINYPSTSSDVARDHYMNNLPDTVDVNTPAFKYLSLYLRQMMATASLTRLNSDLEKKQLEVNDSQNDAQRWKAANGSDEEHVAKCVKCNALVTERNTIYTQIEALKATIHERKQELEKAKTKLDYIVNSTSASLPSASTDITLTGRSLTEVDGDDEQ
tara:strand:- start:540 stop:1805 length:1266 start_codon:yes stop_codon:yes gene_type:complete